MHGRLFRTALLSLAAVAALALAGIANAATGQTIYTLSNSPAGNAVLAFSHTGGVLSPARLVPDRRHGTGGGLGSQGSVILRRRRPLRRQRGQQLDLAVLRATSGGLEWKATVPSGGTMPISLTVHDHRSTCSTPAAGEHHRLRHARDGADADPRLDAPDGRRARRPRTDLVHAATATCSSSPRRPRARSRRSSWTTTA